MKLSKQGQARSLAEFLRRLSFDSCFSSPMKRAVQTAAPCREWAKPVLLSGLREVDFGDWTGLRWEEVREKYGKGPRDWLSLLEANAIPKPNLSNNSALEFRKTGTFSAASKTEAESASLAAAASFACCLPCSFKCRRAKWPPLNSATQASPFSASGKTALKSNYSTRACRH